MAVDNDTLIDLEPSLLCGTVIEPLTLPFDAGNIFLYGAYEW